VRKQIVQQFLVYRARNCRERERWAAILDEAFVFTIPITPFRSFHRKEIQGSHRVVRGIDAMMAECASLALMAESIGLGSPKWRQAIKRYVFDQQNTCAYTYSAQGICPISASMRADGAKA
jgi:hypothetical protein